MGKEIRLFSREAVKVLVKELDEVLERVGKEYGLNELKVESAQFSPHRITLKVTGATREGLKADAGSLSEAESRFFLVRHGLPEGLFTREFEMGGRVFVFERIEPRNPKYPVIARCLEEDRYYKFSVEQARRILEKNDE